MNCRKAYGYVLQKRIPLFGIAYFIIVNGSVASWLVFGLPLLKSTAFGKEQMYLICALVAFAQFSFILSCSLKPGRISHLNITRYIHQPFDGVMFLEGTYCETCKLPKVDSFLLPFELINNVSCFVYHSQPDPSTAESATIASLFSTIIVSGSISASANTTIATSFSVYFQTRRFLSMYHTRSMPSF